MLDSPNSDPRLPDEHDDTSEVTELHSAPLSRRGFGRGLLGASAVAVLFAMGKRDEVQAAPLTDTWRLGGNTGVNTDGTNFLGTNNVAPLVFKTAEAAGSPVERMRILPTGNIGIGTTTPAAKLQVNSTTFAVIGRHSATTGIEPGIYGVTFATVADASGVLGVVRSTSPGTNSAGVLGVNNATNSNGAGVRGSHAGGGNGVHGSSINGIGVNGQSTNGYGSYNTGGYNGSYNTGGSYGVIGYGSGSSATGVYGSGHTGLYGSGSNRGVYAYGNTYGVQAYGGPYGVYASGTSYGVYATGYFGVLGTSSQSHGVYGSTSQSSSSGVQGYGGANGVKGYGSSAGVRGESSYVGVWGEGRQWGLYSVATGTSGTNYGIMAQTKSSSGYAGWFIGRVHVNGTLSKSAGSFKIDHPIDPENKYLSHSFVESPDMMNVYNGNATTDGNGDATVVLPSYFDALNHDFRYQLTVMGQFAQAIVAKEIANNQFSIKTDKPNVKVSWQVTGVRQDAYAKAHPIQVEENKATPDRGRFLNPEVHGKAASLGMATAQRPHAVPDKPSAVQHPQPPKREGAVSPRKPEASE